MFIWSHTMAPVPQPHDHKMRHTANKAGVDGVGWPRLSTQRILAVIDLSFSCTPFTMQLFQAIGALLKVHAFGELESSCR